MEKEVKELGIEMGLTSVLIEWKEYKSTSGIFLDQYTKFEEESKMNQCPKILAVGPTATTAKVGRYAFIPGGCKMVRINGTLYGIVKDHVIEATFKTIPDLGEQEGTSAGEIKLDKTAKKVKEFEEKAKYKVPNDFGSSLLKP